MKIEESLADIETEVGRISMDLQANEHDKSDFERLKDDINNITEELQVVLAKYEVQAEKYCEGSVKFGKAAERMGEMEDAINDLEMARENAVELCSTTNPNPSVEDTTCALDRACDALTRAMRV